ncbi:hypothetical protein [Deinococcus seoulensis]|nr:hypothetical protein [Deinococcus seoulensis]
MTPQVFRSFGFSPAMHAVIAGEFEAPMRGYQRVTPESLYPYPPALLPFWDNDNPSMLGVWQRRFIDRPPTIVSFHLELPFAYEEARNERQFLLTRAFQYVEARGITPELRQFLDAYPLAPDDLLLEAVRQHGDSPQGLRLFSSERDTLPMEVMQAGDTYTGFHPVSSKRLDGVYLQHPPGLICGFEFDPDTSDPALASSMPWLDPDSDIPDLFRQLLAQGRYAEAWMTLNSPGLGSPGWDDASLADGLRQMGSLLRDPEFDVVVAGWLHHHP